MTEQEAEAEVLRICRACPEGQVWCMREINQRTTRFDWTKGLKIVIDNARFSAPLIAQGRTWSEVLDQLHKLCSAGWSSRP